MKKLHFLFITILSLNLNAQIPQWNQVINLGKYYQPKTIATDTANNNIVVGNIYYDNAHFIIKKFDKEGNLLWQKETQSSDDGYNAAWSVITDEECNIYVTGKFNCSEIYFDEFKLTNNKPGEASRLFITTERLIY